MRSFDEMQAMSDEGLEEYLRDEVESIISTAQPHNVLKLRHIQSRMDKIRCKIKNPYMRASMMYQTMMESFGELNDELQKFNNER